MSDSISENDRAISEYASTIVSAFVSKNALPMSELPTLIAATHAALVKLTGHTKVDVVAEPLEPKVSIKKSITPDYLICLEDGRKFKSLRRHLSTAFNMTPDDYRKKWGLPADYPMVAESHSKARSALAKSFGLGTGRAGTGPKQLAAKAAAEKLSADDKTADEKRIEADFPKDNGATPEKAAAREVDAPKATKKSTPKKKAAG